MPLKVVDRVKETTTDTGAGTIDLAGAATGFRTFVDGVGGGNTTYYAITDANGTAWEVGLGTVTDASTDTLSRDTLLASSTGSKIELSSGTHTVFATYPGDKAIFKDGDGFVGIGTDEPSFNLDVYGHDAWVQASGVRIGASGIILGGTAIGATAAEINVLDASAASITTPTVVGGDAFVMDDADVGVVQVDVDNVDTYFSATTKTLTNKTLTSPKINEDVAVSSTATEINLLDGVTASTTELNYIDGVSSAIQGQIDGKQATVTGAATTITGSDLTASRALVSNGSGKVSVSSTTSTEIGYLDISAVGTAEASKALVLDSAKKFEGVKDGTFNQFDSWVYSSGVNIGASGLVMDGVGITTLQIHSESFADNNTSLMTSKAIADKIEDYGYTTNAGDITGVTAGDGLSGGGDTGGVSLALDLSELTAAVVADGDFIAIIDNDDDSSKKEAVHDLATLFAGAGMTATSSVINVIGGNGITANANDIAVTAAQTTITSLEATDIYIGEDSETKVDFGTPNEIHFYANNAHQVKVTDGGVLPVTLHDVDLGTYDIGYKNLYASGVYAGSGVAIHNHAGSGITLKTPTALTGHTDYDLVLPSGQGTAGQVLTSNANGPTYWSTISGGSSRSVAGDTDNGIITWVTSDNTFASEANFTYDGTDIKITAAASGDPTLTIENTNSVDGSTSGYLKFVKDKGSAGADDDVCGSITFYGDNDAQEIIEFARIEGLVADASDGSERGEIKLTLIETGYTQGGGLKENVGLLLTGTNTTGEVDVTIGAGSDSIVTVPGNLAVTGSLTTAGITATANIDIGAYELRAQTLESDVATGTAPLTVASTTVVSNLNADKLDGQEGSYYLDFGNFVIDADEIPISKLASDSVSYGGVSVTLGASDATPAFALADATGLPIVAGTTGTLTVARGGTSLTSIATLLNSNVTPTTLSLVIGTNVQAYDAQLDTLAALTADQVGGLVDLATLEAPASDGQFIVATGAGVFAYESGSTARTSLGLGSAAERAAEDTLTDGANLPDGAAIKAYGDTNWSSGSGDVAAGSTFTTAGVIMACDGDDKTIDEPGATLTTNGQAMTVSSAVATPFQVDAADRDGNSSFKFTTGTGAGTNNQASIQVIAQTAANANLYLGDTALATIGGIKYKNSDNSMQILTNSTVAITIDSSQSVTFAAGVVSTAASNTLGATSFNDANITNVGSLACDSVVVDAAGIGLDVVFGGTTGLNKMTLTDNLGDALNITESSNSYMKFVTTDNATRIITNVGVVSNPTALTSQSGSVVINAALGNYWTVAVTGNITGLDIQNAIVGQKILIRFAWSGSFSVTGYTDTVIWPGGTALSATASGVDVVGFICTTASSAFDAFVIGEDIKAV